MLLAHQQLAKLVHSQAVVTQASVHGPSARHAHVPPKCQCALRSHAFKFAFWMLTE